MKLVLVRHGETQWNNIGKIQGHIDIPLNENGRQVANLTKEAYNKEKITYDVVYASPLSRAQETARILVGENTPIITDKRLMEISFGKYDGSIYSEIMEGKEEYLSFRNCFVNPEKYVADSSAETFEAFIARTGSFLADLKQTYTNDEKILAVCHGGTIRSILQNVEPRPLKDFWNNKIRNLCHVTIEWDENTPFHVIEFGKYYYNIERG